MSVNTVPLAWLLLLAGILPPTAAVAQMPDPPGQVTAGRRATHEAYLFAHMMKGDYGRLYYSVSRDGLHWSILNGGKRVFKDYRGHPDICRGHDRRYYLVGNRSDDQPDINFWVSDDLITWQKYGDYIPDFPKVMTRIGAPKLFYDETGSRYLLTWHTTHDLGRTNLPEPYWAGQRTIYATSSDLKTFSDPPRKLFDWDTATIDVIVHREGPRYYAILKDERYPTLDWTTGKTIRVCSAPRLLGPYCRPGPPVSPGFREAPTLIPSPDGRVWYLYYEQYPGVAYGLSIAASLEGPWFQAAGGTSRRAWDKYNVPAGARHGSMIAISRRELDALVAAFGERTISPHNGDSRGSLDR